MSQMKDSYLLLRLLKANRQQLEKLLGRDWPAFLNLLESTLDSFLHGVPRSGYTRNIRDIIDWVTQDAGERAADILRDVVKSVPVTQALPPGEIEVALPDSPTVVLTVPEGIPAGKVARYQVEEEAEVMMREIVGKKSAAPPQETPSFRLPERPPWEVHYEVPDPEPAPAPGAAYGGLAFPAEEEQGYRGPSDPKRGPAAPSLPVRGEERPRPASTPPTPAPEVPEECRINIWIAERDEASRRPLRPQEPYNLCFQFAPARISSLVSGPQTEIPAKDIPDAGLATEWVVVSTDVEFLPSGPDVEVSETAGSATARFALHIPKSSDSELRKVAIRTRSKGPAKVSAVVFAVSPTGRRERYRELELTLTVEVKMQSDAPVLHTEEEQVAAARHLGLRTTHEWTTPPGELTITVLGDGLPVVVSGNYGGNVIGMTPLQQRWAPAAVGGCIANVRDAAETFRMKWERYLNDIDGDSLAARLQEYGQSPEYDWSQLSDRAEAAHQATWEQVKTSPELRGLAAEGYTLYQEVFPKQDNPLRRWIDNLPPGAKLEISWTSPTLTNIPWGLMYRQPPPRPGGEVDPTAFLGLRHRLSYSTHLAAESSKALGAPDRSHQASFLYRGDQANDVTGVEASWQRKLWAGQPNQILIPSPTAANPRDELLSFWYEPSPSPIAVFYLFCQCKVGNGNAPVLSFGDTLGPDLKRTDLRGTDLVDRPLVFANACTTSSAEPYLANELEADFFRRGCRAFLGTETKVPIPMAARFASIFFEFFYRRVDPEPMAAGEALAQSRIFLWTRYRNLGGLFYTYINQYELFLADDAEVAALRA
jgi:hypothetical protein